jgi:hypothetical protein
MYSLFPRKWVVLAFESCPSENVAIAYVPPPLPRSKAQQAYAYPHSPLTRRTLCFSFSSSRTPIVISSPAGAHRHHRGGAHRRDPGGTAERGAETDCPGVEAQHTAGAEAEHPRRRRIYWPMTERLQPTSTSSSPSRSGSLHLLLLHRQPPSSIPKPMR